MALLLCFGLASAASAQTSSPPPQPLPKEQFDALVEAVKKAVAEELKAQGTPAKATPEKSASASPAGSDDGPGAIGVFGQQLRKALADTPLLISSLADLPHALDESATGGRSTASFLAILLAILAAALAVELVLRAGLARLKLRLAINTVPEKGVGSLINLAALALLDGLPVLGLWFAGELALGSAFTVATQQQRLAYAALTALVIWRLYALVLRLMVRPDLPAARLCAVDDSEAHLLYRRVLAVLLLIICARFLASMLAATGMPDGAIAASRLLAGPIALVALVWLAIASKTAAQQWLGGLGQVARFAGFIGQHWVGLAVSFVVALEVTLVYGVVTGHRNVPEALLLTINLATGLLLFETLMQACVRRLDSQLAGFTPAGTVPTLADVVARCIRIAVLIGVAVLVSESWVVNVLGLVDATAWRHMTRESNAAGITLFIAFVLWEIFRYATDSYMRRHLAGAAASTATRLGTLMPLLRVTVAIVLAVVAVLIALENIGVNVTPLLAGASVLGLAVSFGSQALVKDIVSGIFYLTDDAFRVGEFIDCEKAKGTVESFTLRSIRLRNQNGQIHTIPFGELGHVTNFSRDWAAADFNLRFARDTDLNKLREATDTISADIMAVPELKEMLLEPLKMQGIAEVADNALVVRFKFVAHPGSPGKVQNEAVTRMLRSFPALGIEFAK